MARPGRKRGSPRRRTGRLKRACPLTPAAEDRGSLRSEVARPNRRSLLRRRSRSGWRSGFAPVEARGGGPRLASVGRRKAEDRACLDPEPKAEDRSSLRSRPKATAEGLARIPAPNGTGLGASAPGWNRRRPAWRPRPPADGRDRGQAEGLVRDPEGHPPARKRGRDPPGNGTRFTRPRPDPPSGSRHATRRRR
jgi:hypothetical protein